MLDVKAIADMDGTPRGFGFVNFASFEAADAALESMNGQYLCNLPMHVSYAYKKDGAHGTNAPCHFSVLIMMVLINFFSCHSWIHDLL